jgi:hypothetical protein
MSVALMPQIETLAGFEGAGSYFSAPDDAYLSLLSRAPFNAMRLLRVRFVVLMADVAEERVWRSKGFAPAGPGLLLREIVPVSPPAFLLGAARAEYAAKTEALLADVSFDFARIALVEPEASALIAGLPETAPPDAGRVDLTARTARTRELSVQARAPAVAVLSEHFDPGWTATVDGVPAPVLRVDRVLIGVPVPAGNHTVLLRFSPVGLGFGLLAAATCVGLIAAWAVARRRALSLE